MKKCLKMFFLIVLFLSSGRAYADEALTWLDCIGEAQKNNPELISAEESIRQSESSKKIAASTFFPQIDSSVSAARANAGDTTKNTYAYGVTGTQLIFDGFKTANNVTAATENLKATQQGYRFTSSQVRYRLRSAFINLLRAQELIRVTEEIVKIRRDNLALISLRYESGLEHRGAKLNSEANLAAAKFSLARARRSLEVAQRQLTKEMGRTEFVPMTVKSDFLIDDSIKEKPDFESFAKNNPSLLQLVAQENAAAFGIKSAQASFYPKISAQGGAGETGSQWPPNGDHWNAGITMTLPLFEGGLKTAQVAQARALFNQAQANKRSVGDNVVVTLEQTWAALQDAVEQVDVQNKSLIAAEERAKIGEAQYSVGFLSYDNWSILEDNLVQAKNAYLDAQASALLAEANWIQAKGETLEYAQK
jgi:TolC family type I secretion outer membrane protein